MQQNKSEALVVDLKTTQVTLTCSQEWEPLIYLYASQKLIYSNRLWNTGGKGVEYKMLITVVFTIGKYKWWCNYLII